MIMSKWKFKSFVLCMVIFFLIPIVKVVSVQASDSSEIDSQITKRMKLYGVPAGFAFPPISTILRMTSPELVEKVETLYFFV